MRSSADDNQDGIVINEEDIPVVSASTYQPAIERYEVSEQQRIVSLKENLNIHLIRLSSDMLIRMKTFPLSLVRNHSKMLRRIHAKLSDAGGGGGDWKFRRRI